MSELSSEWIDAVSVYHKGHMAVADLKPIWRKEVERLLRFAIDEDKEHHLDPLFKNGWGPQDAATHLRIVWAMKGWV